MSYFDFQTTPRYIQCEQALREIRRYTFGMGKRFLILTACGPVTDHVVSIIKNSFSSSMEANVNHGFAEKNYRYNRQIAEAKRFDSQNTDVYCEFLDLEGKEVTVKQIDALKELVLEKNFDVVIGVGGGKGMDFARGTAFETGVRSVLVPTAAATNASATQLCIVYNEAGTQWDKVLFLPNYQDLVIADTSILINAPVRTFLSGIADQLCTYYETLYSGKRLEAENEFPALCWDVVNAGIEILYTHGKAAVDAAKNKTINHEYESVLSQVLHSCGPARAVAGSGFSHTLDKALMRIQNRSKKVLHGEQVGYGVIPMMIAEGESLAVIHRYIDFCLDINIPINLAQLGLQDVLKAELEEACKSVTMNPSSEVPFTYNTFVDCVMKAEAISGAYA